MHATDFCHLIQKYVHPVVARSRPLIHGSRRGSALGGLGLERLGRVIPGFHGPGKSFSTHTASIRTPLRGRDMGLLDPRHDGRTPSGTPVASSARAVREAFASRVAHPEAAKDRFHGGA
jgi:hypothetical protein